MNVIKIFLGLAFVYPLVIYSQTSYDQLNIKEHFDNTYIKSYQDLSFAPFNNLHSDVSHEHNLGSTRTPPLEALLLMYETTKDKMYLFEFMNITEKIMDLRKDIYYNNPDSLPLWFTENCKWHGRLLWPLSHFVYRVFNSWQDLYNVPIDPNLYRGYSTMGSYAVWLNDRLIESMDRSIINWWISNTEGFAHYCDKSNVGVMNFQAPWGCALIYLYMANNNTSTGTDYGVKAVKMAEMYLLKQKSNHETINGITYDQALEVISCPCNQGSNCWSYTWQHNGWKEGGPLVEDIAHGIWDVLFPLLYNQYYDQFYPHLTSGQYFEDYQLVRFRNTLSAKLWNSTDNGFNNAVDGSAGPVDAQPNSNPYPDWQPVAKAWMPLYTFDIHSNTCGLPLYQLIIDYYVTEGTGGDPRGNNYSDMRTKGLADLVKAQWDKECFSLTLKNRNLDYNQDFFAKNALTVNPEFVSTDFGGYAAESSFADPSFISEEFIINSNVTSNMSAGNKLVFKPGFTVKSGAAFRAYIDPALTCSISGKWSGSISDVESDEDEKTKEGKSFSFQVSPNPTVSGKLLITLSDKDIINVLTITDILGNVIMNKEVANSQIELDVSNFAKGIYIISCQTDHSMYSQKIVYF